MKRVLFIFLVFWGIINQAPGQETTYDVEFTRVCLIDSIAPDTVNQFWRFTQANNPGGIIQDYEFDLSGPYTPTGTVLPCCSCLTAASDLGEIFPGKPSGSFRWVWLFFGFAGVIGFGWIIGFMAMVLHGKSKRTRIAYFLPMAFLFSYSSLSAQSETRYDIEFTCVCLIDSIAPDTIIQFYRFTQANNPGGIIQDYQYDLSGPYTPTGTVMGCNDYYLGDNPGGSGTAGTLAIWTGTNSLGNSSVTESGQVISSSLTGALKLPSGTDAQDPVWSAGMLRYNTTANGIQGYDGTAERYLPWADADSWAANRIPYSNGTNLVSSSNFTYDGSKVIIDRGNDGTILEGKRSTTRWFLNEKGIWIGTNTDINSFNIQVDGVGTRAKTVLYNGGTNGWYSFYIGSSEFAKISASTYKFNGSGIETNNLLGHQNYSTLTIKGAVRATGAGQDVILQAGSPECQANNGGNLYIRNSNINDLFNGTCNYNGVPGDIFIQARGDTTNGVTPVLYTYFHVDSDAKRVRLGNVPYSNSAIKTLTLTVGDTLSYRAENLGSISTSTDGSGDIVVAHGMGTTPTSVQVTVTGTTPYVVTIHTIDATNFTVRFYDMTGAAVTSTAVTATWHAKT